MMRETSPSMFAVNELATTFPQSFLVFIFFFGLVAGSCLSMVSYRLPIMLQSAWQQEAQHILNLPQEPAEGTYNLFLPRSSCTHCKHHIAWFDNIPILSWFIRKGRCRHCQKKISIRYPLIEVTTALATLVVAQIFPISTAFYAALLFSWWLVLLAVIDLEHYLLPDQLTLSLLWGGLLVNITDTFVPLQDAVVGAMIGYLCLWSLFWLFKWLTHKEGLGYGDFKLLAALGAWLGWQALPLVLLCGALLGLVFYVLRALSLRDTTNMVPFGSCLALSGWIYLLWGDDVSAWYARFIWKFYV